MSAPSDHPIIAPPASGDLFKHGPSSSCWRKDPRYGDRQPSIYRVVHGTRDREDLCAIAVEVLGDAKVFNAWAFGPQFAAALTARRDAGEGAERARLTALALIIGRNLNALPQLARRIIEIRRREVPIETTK